MIQALMSAEIPYFKDKLKNGQLIEHSHLNLGSQTSPNGPDLVQSLSVSLSHIERLIHKSHCRTVVGYYL